MSTGHTHTHTDREHHPRHRPTHTTRTTPQTPQTNTSHNHLKTLEGGATTVRATSHAKVGGPSHGTVITNIVWCIAYEKNIRRGSRILPKNRAIVLHQGGQCRWAGGMKGWLIRAQQPRRKTISCKGQRVGWPRRICFGRTRSGFTLFRSIDRTIDGSIYTWS